MPVQRLQNCNLRVCVGVCQVVVVVFPVSEVQFGRPVDDFKRIYASTARFHTNFLKGFFFHLLLLFHIALRGPGHWSFSFFEASWGCCSHKLLLLLLLLLFCCMWLVVFRWQSWKLRKSREAVEEKFNTFQNNCRKFFIFIFFILFALYLSFPIKCLCNATMKTRIENRVRGVDTDWNLIDNQLWRGAT